MKKSWLILGLIGLASLLFAGAALCERGTIELGEQLFNDPALGGSTNETSCATCHPQGKGLEQAGRKTNLGHMINVCIERPLEGTALEKDSVELDALMRYIKSL